MGWGFNQKYKLLMFFFVFFELFVVQIIFGVVMGF
jgi:hypothetical protein